MSDELVPLASIIGLAQDLVRTPSRAFEDDPINIIGVIAQWAERRQLSFHQLSDSSGKKLGGYFHYASGKSGPAVCLNACIDTCQYGAIETWNDSPTSAKIDGDYLYGRGAADSKIAVSMFCHIFAEAAQRGLAGGDLYVLLDADEHTGNFGGVKSFLAEEKNLDIVFIGYPGENEIMIGARGFLRATLSVYGSAAHSGSRSPVKDNAIIKATQLIEKISTCALPAETDPYFPFGAKVTVTAINGGQGFSQIPDKVDVNIDMRLTPSFNKMVADQWLRAIVKDFNSGNVSASDVNIAYHESWPSYNLDKTHPAVAALQKNAEAAFGHAVALSVCGPSNIGNLLASKGIPALCGFGAEGANIHAPNESVKISSINPAYQAYRQTLKDLCR